ncbi:MAG: HAD hydrolase-like protein, partial [Candidatus Acidiferrales bacterium]
IYYCPHIRDDNCNCRKPLPGMLERAAAEHNLELKGSVLVSDRYDDIAMAHAAGCTGILVLSGYGRGEHQWNRHGWPSQPDSVVENLKEAVDLICETVKK